MKLKWRTILEIYMKWNWYIVEEYTWNGSYICPNPTQKNNERKEINTTQILRNENVSLKDAQIFVGIVFIQTLDVISIKHLDSFSFHYFFCVDEGATFVQSKLHCNVLAVYMESADKWFCFRCCFSKQLQFVHIKEVRYFWCLIIMTLTDESV